MGRGWCTKPAATVVVRQHITRSTDAWPDAGTVALQAFSSSSVMATGAPRPPSAIKARVRCMCPRPTHQPGGRARRAGAPAGSRASGEVLASLHRGRVERDDRHRQVQAEGRRDKDAAAFGWGWGQQGGEGGRGHHQRTVGRAESGVVSAAAQRTVARGDCLLLVRPSTPAHAGAHVWRRAWVLMPGNQSCMPRPSAWAITALTYRVQKAVVLHFTVDCKAWVWARRRDCMGRAARVGHFPGRCGRWKGATLARPRKPHHALQLCEQARHCCCASRARARRCTGGCVLRQGALSGSRRRTVVIVYACAGFIHKTRPVLVFVDAQRALDSFAHALCGGVWGGSGCGPWAGRLLWLHACM